MDNMLQGLGFGTGLQQASDQRSASARLANTDLQLRGSGISFTNRIRTINASDPSGMSTALSMTAAGANAYAGTPGAFSGGTKTPTKIDTTLGST